MKILFFGLSSKFIHTLPSGWFLAEYLGQKNIEVVEKYHSVNENYQSLLAEVLADEWDIILFSVYIFNVKCVRRLIEDIRKERQCKIIVGGPEVDENFDADHIVIGEGEDAIYRLLTLGGDRVVYGKNICNLDDIPSPYTIERLQSSSNKLIYYESSRGCPFSCSYCMAGVSRGVRYFSLDRVKSDLQRIADSGAKVVKFTDRTFNAHTSRTNDILTMIRDNFAKYNVCFHFEVGGDLFKPSTLEILKTMPVGLVQMEAGVQTLNEASLEAVNRKFNRNAFLHNITQILSFGNIHMHLDLIAGLPCESMDSFIYSFNSVFELRPHKLQLGFLKMLKNTPIRDSYNALYENDAPYEIISTPHISSQELDTLRQIDWVNERLYNSGKFSFTLEYLLKNTTPYQLFYEISQHFACLGIKKGADERLVYAGVLSFCDGDARIKDYLRFDYLVTNNSRKIPKAIKTVYEKEYKRFYAAQKKDAMTCYQSFSYLPFMSGKDTYIVKFDYSYKNPVTSRYAYEVLDLHS